MLELPVVSIPDETGPVAHCLMRLFRRSHERFWSAVGPLTAAQIDWRPTPEADSIGMILEHVLTAERTLLDLLIGVEPDSPPEAIPAHRAGRTGIGRMGVDASAYLGDLGAQYQRGMVWLASREDGQFGDKRVRWWDGRETTVEREVEHLLDHLAYHRGQIAYISMLDGFPGSR
jgi:uncharacterized damage-inducible protein DinB